MQQGVDFASFYFVHPTKVKIQLRCPHYPIEFWGEGCHEEPLVIYADEVPLQVMAGSMVHFFACLFWRVKVAVPHSELHSLLYCLPFRESNCCANEGLIRVTNTSLSPA